MHLKNDADFRIEDMNIFYCAMACKITRSINTAIADEFNFRSLRTSKPVSPDVRSLTTPDISSHH